MRPHLAQCFELLPAQGAFVLAELSWLNAMSLHPVGPLSLHPHILVWLLQAQLQVLLEMLQRERDAFQGRLSLWMREVVRAVVATQHSAVTELPTYLQGGSNEAEVAVPPLPFGPTEKRYYAADGGVETATNTNNTSTSSTIITIITILQTIFPS